MGRKDKRRTGKYMPDAPALIPARVGLADIRRAVAEGISLFRACPRLSMSYAAIFTMMGLGFVSLLELLQWAPLNVSLAGGFMLVGPVTLSGFFAMIDAHRAGSSPTFGDVVKSFTALPRGCWAIAFVCTLLFAIWMTDAGTLYTFIVSETQTGIGAMLPPRADVARFLAYSSIMGAVLALIIFAVSAFSIPLIRDGRADMVSGVVASVRAIFANFPVMMAWALLLSLTIIASILLLPLLLVTLPVMAFASHSLYLCAYPR
jgi:uncharacterized membrane protein